MNILILAELDASVQISTPLPTLTTTLPAPRQNPQPLTSNQTHPDRFDFNISIDDF